MNATIMGKKLTNLEVQNEAEEMLLIHQAEAETDSMTFSELCKKCDTMIKNLWKNYY